jgi:adenylate kinase family enzyme
MKIHILGASGAGSTTLAKELAKRLNINDFDSDNYLWLDTNPPYQKKRELNERVTLLKHDLINNEDCLLSGSIYDWGDELIDLFDLIVFLWIPSDIRMKRLKQRDIERYGDLINEGEKRHQMHVDFMAWASKYDNGDVNIRSRKSHELWLDKASCKLLKIEGNFELDYKVEKILSYIQED